MNITPKPVICLMGPTATGKTALAIALAAYLPIHLVSVDSAMVYRGMNIGSGKPSTPHALIDICDPTEAYSAAQFRQDALACIEKIYQNQQIPLLVGGTMLYFKVLQQGIADLPPANPNLRARILEEAYATGWASIHAKLAQVDPLAAKRIHINDPQRLQRAWEVYLLTGKSLSEHWNTQQAHTLPYYFINIALSIDRTVLHQRIEARFDDMLAHGLVEEVKDLLSTHSLSADLPSMKSVGYQQARQYILGEIDAQQMREQTLVATRQLAKRQFTWLRSWPAVTWFDAQSPDLLIQVKNYLAGVCDGPQNI